MNSYNLKPQIFAKKYFIQTFKSHTLMILFTGLVFFFAHQYIGNKSSHFFFWSLLILLVLNLFITMWITKPMNKVLRRLSSINIRLEHEFKDNRSYNEDDWSLIHKSLSLIENEIDLKKNKLKDSTLQADIILSSISTSVAVIDKFQNIIQANKSFDSEFRKKKLTENKLWRIIDNKVFRNRMESCLENETAMEFLAFSTTDSNSDSRKFYDIHLTPLRDNQDKFIGAVGVFHDVTSRKLTEQMRVDFVANVSHEMRTPLTSLKGYAQLLQVQSKSLPESIINISKKIENNSERLKDLFTSLLSLSKLESQSSISVEEVNLKLLVQKVISDLQAKHIDKKISLKLELKEDIFFVDPKLIEQVFLNLIDNSIKYAVETPLIKIRSYREANFFKIILADNGPGIREENLNRIFERFYRVQGESTEVIEGVGLGLSIVKHIINKHNAIIAVESNLNRGTTFNLSFPILKKSYRENKLLD